MRVSIHICARLTGRTHVTVIAVAAAALVTVMCCSSATLSGELFPRDRIILPFSPAAAVEGPVALRFNPAGLAFEQGTALNYFHNYSDSSANGDDGVYLSFKGFGVSTEWLGSGPLPDGHSYSIGVATSKDQSFSVGGAYQWRSSDDPVQNKSHFWSTGVTWRPSDWLSLAAVANNYNRMKLDGARTDAEFTYSAALNFLDGRFIIGGDWYQTTSQRVKDGTHRLAASFEVTDGLTVFSDIDEDENYFLGGRINLTNAFVGTHSHFRKDDGYSGGVFYVGMNEERRRSLVRLPQEIVTLRLSGEVPDRPPPRRLIGSAPLTAFEWVQLLEKAAQDPMVSAVLLTIDHPQLGGARAEEIRRAIARTRATGKYVVVYLDGVVSNREYFLATAADMIVIPPVSSVDLIGLRAEVTFVKRLLSKLGIEADLERTGKYKTAADLVERTEMSDAHREALNRLLDDIDAYWTQEMAIGRQTSVERVREWIAHGPFISVDAKAAGLVDAVAHGDELEGIVREVVGRTTITVSQRAFLRRSYHQAQWGTPPSVAVVFAEGSIMEGEDDETFLGKVMGGRTISHALRQAREDRNVQAVVLRVNSGGGSVFASDRIWREVSRTIGVKPIIVSFGDVAASGGYYIAAAADSVFTLPNTITGSIGVINGKVVLDSLYEKIGVDKEVLTRGRYADMFGTTREFDEQERAVIRSQIEKAYERFVGLVAEGRGLSEDSVMAVGQGRVWSGAAALEIGLADRDADLSEAIGAAAHMAGIDAGTTVQVIALPKRRWQFFDSGLLTGLSATDGLARGLGYALEKAGFGGGLRYEMPHRIIVR
jgi:protease-4